MLKGYMLFAADTPLIGLDPHPAYAPQPIPEAFGSAIWGRAYGVGGDRQALEREAQEDLAAARDAVEAGDLSDWSEEPDFVLPVSVSDDGVLTVMFPDGSAELATYTPEQVYGAFGMICPDILPDQRAGAWAVIRAQMDRLAEELRDTGLDRAETEYRLEDGIAGLQEIRLIRSDGGEVDVEIARGAVPPLVSLSEYGRMVLTPSGAEGTLRDHAEAVFESLAELVLNDPDLVVDRIGLRLSSDGTLCVETESALTRAWTPPSGERAPVEDGPSGP